MTLTNLTPDISTAHLDVLDGFNASDSFNDYLKYMYTGHFSDPSAIS
jgi:hypothetical protein